MRPSRKSRPVPPPHHASGLAAVAPPPEPRPLPPFQVIETSRRQEPPRPPIELTDAMIAERAYAIWQQRGCPVGEDGQRDWFEAAAQLRAELAR